MSLVSDPRIAQAFSYLPDYLGSHVRVSVTALLLGLAVSLPLAILARDRPVLRATLLAAASIVQTVPGLALLALFYPLLLVLASFSLAWFGFSFSAFGFLPAVLACKNFELKAELRWGTQKKPKTFLLSHRDKLVWPGADPGTYVPPELGVFVEGFRKRVSDNMPYDQIVKGVMTATSLEGRSPEEWLEATNKSDRTRLANPAARVRPMERSAVGDFN